jgi:hypothetical protein
VILRLTPAWRLRATLAAFVLPLFVYLVPLDRVARWIRRGPMRSSPNDAVDDRALAEWVDRVLDRLPPPWRRTCLKRALVLHYLVRRAGRPTELRIGVRRDQNNTLAAHAWLVRDDVPYLEPGADHAASYQVLTAFSSIGEVDR